ncbi:MAG: DUF3352 domain-containing protein [Cyanobacteria bacterium P01_D01_bin.128]
MLAKTKVLKDRLLTLKKPPLRLVIGIVALGGLGGAMVYGWLTWQNLRPKNLPVGVEAVPETAIASFTVATDDEDWQQLRQFGTETTQAQWDELWLSWRDRLLTDNGLSFERDILPWVGENITLALLPDSGNVSPSPSVAQSWVLLLPIDDVAAARATLGNDQLPEATTRTYRGIDLQEFPTSGETQDETQIVAGVLSAKLVLVATTPEAAEAAIDAFKGGKSLADLGGYSDAINQAQDDNTLARFYLNLPQVTQAIALNAEPPLPAAELIPFKQNQGFVGNLAVRSDGVHVRGVSWLSGGSDRTYVVNNQPSSLPRKLPAQTLMMASGVDLRQFWINYSQGATAGSLLPFNPDNFRATVQATTGLDLDADLLPWMEGEFALAMVTPRPAQNTPEADPEASEEGGGSVELPVGFVFLVKTSDRTLAETTLGRLDQVAGERYRFDVNTVDLNGVAATRWVSPFGSLEMTHGWLDGETAFFTVGNGVAEQIVPSPRRALAATQPFQTTTALAPDENSGHFFINAEALLSLESLFQPANLGDDLGANPEPLTSAVRSLGVTTAIADNRNVIYDVYVLMEKGPRPKPIPAPELESAPDPPPADEREDGPENES